MPVRRREPRRQAPSSVLEAEADPYGYFLPEHRIALRPAEPRSAARMLVSQPDGARRDLLVRDLPDCLAPGDLLVVNDTRVLQARMRGLRVRAESAARIEITLLRPLGGPLWRVLAKPLRRLRAGDDLKFGDLLSALVVDIAGGSATLAFNQTGESFYRALQEAGEIPLPPYITRRRPADERDTNQYQTIFAAKPGAVAAPTAGLHFDDPLLGALSRRGVQLARVTLHVGGGTFLPIRPGRQSAHSVEAEWGCVGEAAAAEIRAARRRKSRVIAVGTTSLRLLETAAIADSSFSAWEGETTLFIRPGHRFRVADALFTNFHLPNSTLFVLACAFIGIERCQRLYRHALENGYRFYSYGDASLLFRT